MAFRSAAESIFLERPLRDELKGKLLAFGNSFLDDSLLGIRPDDLILVGAPSGVGKTQFCVNIAIANVRAGKRVHFFALEAAQFEIERRLKYQLIASEFYSNPNRPAIGRPLRFDEWEVGEFTDVLKSYEEMADGYCKNMFGNLHTFYKVDKDFNVNSLIENVTFVQDETDLIIIDHVHYFDWDDTDDNRAIKEIAKTARDLCLRSEKPIVLVAHLRKKDRQNCDLAAGLDEFHGSSDLTKIATKVITIAPGGPCPVTMGGYITYIRTPKNRHSSSSSRYLAQIVFNENRGGYETEYKIGWANSKSFRELSHSERPSWFGRSLDRREKPKPGGDSNSNISRMPSAVENSRRYRNYAPGADND